MSSPQQAELTDEISQQSATPYMAEPPRHVIKFLSQPSGKTGRAWHKKTGKNTEGGHKILALARRLFSI